MFQLKLRRAFTLVELLTVIAIIAILAAILIPTVNSVIRRGEQTAGQSILRSIGTGIQLYAVDNNDRLPGPLWPGQVAYYHPDEDERMVVQLASVMDYLQSSEGRVVEAFAPPAFWAEVGYEQAENMRAYVLQMNVEDVDGNSFQPFGKPAAMNNGKAIEGLRMGQVMNRIPKDTWLMSDADQQHTNVASAPWSDSTTPEPYHGSSRNTLYWDGRVEAVPVD